MAKIGRPIKFVIRLTPEERTRLDGMIHCGKGDGIDGRMNVIFKTNDIGH